MSLFVQRLETRVGGMTMYRSKVRGNTSQTESHSLSLAQLFHLVGKRSEIVYTPDCFTEKREGTHSKGRGLLGFHPVIIFFLPHLGNISSGRLRMCLMHEDKWRAVCGTNACLEKSL